MSEKINFPSLWDRCRISSMRGQPTFTVEEVEPLLEIISERTAQARMLAATVANFLDGIGPDDPWPHRVNELCERLRGISDGAQG